MQNVEHVHCTYVYRWWYLSGIGYRCDTEMLCKFSDFHEKWWCFALRWVASVTLALSFSFSCFLDQNSCFPCGILIFVGNNKIARHIFRRDPLIWCVVLFSFFLPVFTTKICFRVAREPCVRNWSRRFPTADRYKFDVWHRKGPKKGKKKNWFYCKSYRFIFGSIVYCRQWAVPSIAEYVVQNNLNSEANGTQLNINVFCLHITKCYFGQIADRKFMGHRGMLDHRRKYRNLKSKTEYVTISPYDREWWLNIMWKHLANVVCTA